MQRRAGTVSPKLLARIRLQLPLGIFVAGLGPYIVRLWIAPIDKYTLSLSAINVTFILTIVSICLGYYFLRSIAVFPGIKTEYYVTPCFVISYFLLAFILLMARVDYSRSVFITSMMFSVTLYFIIFAVLRRTTKLRIGVVPFGSVDELSAVRSVAWQHLRVPEDLSEGFDAIVADFRADLPGEWERALADRALAGQVVYHSKQLQETLTGRVQIEHLSENSFGSLVPLVAYQKIKAALDFLFALAMLPIVLLILLVIGSAVRLTSPGPAIFKQRRIGYRGAVFVVYKMRSMRNERRHSEDILNLEQDRRLAMTQNEDDRITPIGRFLRRSRLDELPQIFNILKGEMSWIGPRPEAESLSNWYESELPFYKYRHVVRPGITGWAQVNQGHVHQVEDVRQKLQNDFFYIKFFSPWLDILILFKTIMTVLTGFGSK